jgi:hypothetical protein
MRTSEGKMHPGATHGRPPELPSLYTLRESHCIAKGGPRPYLRAQAISPHAAGTMGRGWRRRAKGQRRRRGCRRVWLAVVESAGDVAESHWWRTGGGLGEGHGYTQCDPYPYL